MAIRERYSVGNLVARAITWAQSSFSLRETSKGNYSLTLDPAVRDAQSIRVTYGAHTITLKYTSDSLKIEGVLLEANAVYLKNNTGDEVAALATAAGDGGALMAMWDGSVSSGGTGSATNQQLVIADLDDSGNITAADGSALTQV